MSSTACSASRSWLRSIAQRTRARVGVVAQFGGEAGEPPRVVLNPGTEHAREMLKANSLRVREDDVLRCESGGGGGYGTPAG
ncbi:hydantoinase B/oxoprolinase family protein [Amycolatopsis sp. NPDC058986]|uniref:hydantoinase B/oxoprolinase family protein n=1 Tax=unclassified Amycolatopsis TaxID=2618356 RepID=UPI00366FAAAF